MIILLGNNQDPQVAAIATELQKRDVRSIVFDSAAFPQSQQLSYYPEAGDMALRFDANSIWLSDIHKLYWRSYAQPQLPEANLVAQRDSDSLLLSFLALLGDRAVNSADAVRFHREKSRQLATVAAHGIEIPATYIGNDPDDIRSFCELNGDCIFKPVVGGDYAQRVGPSHLLDEHMQRALKCSPITLQRFISGTNVRSYVIGDEVFTAEIRSDKEDFRLDSDVEILPFVLPDVIERQARLAKNLLGLSWTAIDWRRDDAGTYYFLEANPSPMFVNFERNSGFPLAERLANLLAN